MGSDLSVVNAARVSFDKESEWDGHNGLGDRDSKLIRYLATHDHWSPFAHTSLSFRIKAPIFVARQLGKHQVGLVWNEVSRRYVDSLPEFYNPEVWRKRADNVKQGSAERPVDPVLRVNAAQVTTVDDAYNNLVTHAEQIYNELIDHGVCPEQARMVLPQSMMTEWIWTGSLMAFARVCNLRLDPHTQKETQSVALSISSLIQPLFPVSWSTLVA